MISKDKLKEYIERVERCIPEMIKSIHISLPREVMGLKLTVSQALTLVSLGYKKSCRMSELAESVGMNMSSMTGIVDGLIETEVVERMRSKKDRRVVMVQMTPKGKKIVNKIRKYREKEVRDIVEYLDEKEREEIIRGFEKVVEAFSKISKQKKETKRTIQTR